MTPVCKIVTAKSAVRVASETIEGFGGAGYMEDVGVARHLRDAQVFPIWEGAPNVLALDMLRAMGGANGLEPLIADMQQRLSRADAPELRDSWTRWRGMSRRCARLPKLCLRPMRRRSRRARAISRFISARCIRPCSHCPLRKRLRGALASVPRALAARISPWRVASLRDVEASVFPREWPDG